MRIQCNNKEIHLIKHLISPTLFEAFENRIKNKHEQINQQKISTLLSVGIDLVIT